MTDELLIRSPHNPILTAEQWPYPMNSVMNAAATIVGDETLLLVRVEDRRGFSHLTVARSADGETDWRIDETPLIAPQHHYEEWGVEDPRITWFPDEKLWVIAYTAFSPRGTMVALARTTDFVTIDRLGPVVVPDDKNAVILPCRVDGDYLMYHRPSLRSEMPGVWCSRSKDLVTWSSERRVMGPRAGNFWDCKRIGMGTPPIWTEHGWLAFYHGVREAVAGDLYRVGAVLLDLEDPAVVLHRTQEWLLTPRARYEQIGDVPGVLFPCGAVVEGDALRLYYGAADTTVGMAQGSLSRITQHLLGCPPD
ncbi:MAG: hypothetical protein ABIS84_12325 [Arachnia sp.]